MQELHQDVSNNCKVVLHISKLRKMYVVRDMLKKGKSPFSASGKEVPALFPLQTVGAPGRGSATENAPSP